MFIMNMCIRPVKPFGAGSSILCLLHQRAGISTQSRSKMASMKSTQVVFVMDMSKGVTSCPFTFSTILLGFCLASAFFMTRLYGPGLSPLASGSSEKAALLKICQPVELFTITGRWMTALPKMCQSYESLICPHKMLLTSTDCFLEKSCALIGAAASIISSTKSNCLMYFIPLFIFT